MWFKFFSNTQTNSAINFIGGIVSDNGTVLEGYQLQVEGDGYDTSCYADVLKNCGLQSSSLIQCNTTDKIYDHTCNEHVDSNLYYSYSEQLQICEDISINNNRISCLEDQLNCCTRSSFPFSGALFALSGVAAVAFCYIARRSYKKASEKHGGRGEMARDIIATAQELPERSSYGLS